MYQLGSSERADLSLAVVIGAGAMGMAVARRLAQRHPVLLADIDGAGGGRGAGLRVGWPIRPPSTLSGPPPAVVQSRSDRPQPSHRAGAAPVPNL